MIDAAILQLWLMRALYFGLCLAVMFFSLLPVDMSPSRIAGPELITALTFALALRRPEIVPALSVAAAALMADLVLQRPPGLWAALTLVTIESLKTRQRQSGESAFLMEWTRVATALIVMALIYQLVQLLLIIPTANATLLFTQTAATILVYPLVVAVTHLVFGLKRTRRGEEGRFGLGL
ncbi:membrane protein [Roseivivax halodurans JCM 10272]|uniref:Membrane protein n=1 Tax=Roseivivax halodurans JCM 10272 TaxID=1449350 RepID=X7EJZ9_9RHOB|nr:hypothetical protein [Roseivivax halodurans]ETX15463.1 membrane protein [Roseivivax halodurans JCM 10272]